MEKNLSNICNYMKENPTKSIEETAEYFGYSKYYFSRNFKKITGFSASKYISNIKLEETVSSLLEKDKSVLASHLNSGFLSSTTFSNTFKKTIGISPKKLKNEKMNIYENAKYFEKDKRKSEVSHFDKILSTNNKCTVLIEYPEDYAVGITYVGLFNTLIPNHKPIVGKAIINKNYCVLDNIPTGKFYLLVCSVPKTNNIVDYFVLKSSLRGKAESYLMFPNDNNILFNVKVRKAIDSDPPITISLATLLKRNMKSKKDNL